MPSSLAVISIGSTNTSHIMVSNLSRLARLFSIGSTAPATSNLHHSAKFDLLKPLREWLDNLKISNPRLAHKLCQLIPSQCPFERDICCFGQVLLHIPPLCKLRERQETSFTSCSLFEFGEMV